MHIIYLMMPGFRITRKELIQLNNKKTGTPSKKRAKHLSSDFSKDKTSNKHMKIFSTSLAIRKMEIKTSMRDFPGGSVAKTLGSQQRGPRVPSWSGNQIPHATTKPGGSQINKYLETKTGTSLVVQ